MLRLVATMSLLMHTPDMKLEALIAYGVEKWGIRVFIHCIVILGICMDKYPKMTVESLFDN